MQSPRKVDSNEAIVSMLNVFTKENVDKNNCVLSLLYIIGFLDCLIWGLYAPVLPHFHQQHDISVKLSGLYASIMSGISFFSSPMLGKASDKYGRRNLFLVVGSISNCIGLLICLLAPDYQTFILGRYLQAIFRVSNVILYVCLSENCTPMETGQRFANLGAAQAVAFIIGPIAGGQLAILDHRTPFWIASALCVLNAVLAFFVTGKPINEKNDSQKNSDNMKSSSKAWLTKEFTFMFHVKIAFTFGNCIYESVFAQHMLTQLLLDGTSIGWMLGYIGICFTFASGMVVRPYAVIIERQYGALILALFVHALGLVLWAMTTHIILSMVASFFIAISNSVVSNYIQTGVVLRTSPGNKGEILGYSQSMERAAKTVAPFVGGYAFHSYGIIGLAAISSIPSIYCAIVCTCFPMTLSAVANVPIDSTNSNSKKTI